jgi:PleD family two-component response regulator
VSQLCRCLNHKPEKSESQVAKKIEEPEVSLFSFSTVKATRTLRILIAEDNAVNQKVVAMFLKKIGGIEFDMAYNGEEAVRLYKELHFDAILMDCQMPIKDGYQATREIRKLENEWNATHQLNPKRIQCY